MRRLLLLSYTFPPDNTAAAVRPGQLFDFLPAHGYRPIVIASRGEGSQGQNPLVQRVPNGQESGSVQFAQNAAAAFMRWLAPYDDRLTWAPAAASAAARLIRSQPVDAIFSTSPFLASHFVASWLKAKFGVPWIADFQDPVRDNPFRTRKWIYPYDSMIERHIFARADRLIANTDTVVDAWGKRYPHYASKISVLWNSFDPREEIADAPRPPRTYKVLAHVGTLYGERHPEKLLTAIERLGIRPSELRVRLVGPFETQILDRHRPLFDRMRQDGVLEIDNRLASRQEALRETGDADFLLLLDLNEKNASFQLPSKLLDYVRYGKPILAYTPKDSPVERILARSGVTHVAIDPREPDALGDQKVQAFLRSPTGARPMSTWFAETFNAETQARTVAALLDGLLKVEPKSGIAL